MVGGLLSAHLLMHFSKLELDPGWPCEGRLLQLAVDAAEKLLPGYFFCREFVYIFTIVAWKTLLIIVSEEIEIFFLIISSCQRFGK